MFKSTAKVNRSEAKAMVFELEIYNAPPPLVLLINPSNLEIRMVPKVSEQRIRWAGNNIPYVLQVHHDELDVLSASGRSAMFIAENEGLTRVNRTKTWGYDNISKLLAIYRNNGMNINPKVGSAVSPCMIDSVGRVIISYNGFIYKGHFTNFALTENDTTQFNIDFSFEFKITKTFNVDWTKESNILKGLSLL